MSVTNPSPNDHIRWICNTSTDDGKNSIKSLLRDRAKHTDAELLEIFEKAQAQEIHTGHRKSLIVALRSAIKQVTPKPAAKNPKPENAGPITTEVIPAPKAILQDACKALEKLRQIVCKHEETFHAATLGPRLQIGLQCLKAHQVFCVSDPKKSGAMKGKKALTRERLSVGSFKDWLVTEAQWLKEPTAYKYMTAVRGLGLDHTATEKQVAAALKLLIRKGPVTITSLCAAAIEAIGPPAPPPPNLQQSEFEFLKQGLTSFREETELLLNMKDKLKENPDFHRAACARLYSALVAMSGSNWKPSDEPDDLALVDPDAITI